MFLLFMKTKQNHPIINKIEANLFPFPDKPQPTLAS